MNRWLALAIAIPLGGAIAWFATMALFVAVAAFAWLYVFGDSPWPEWFDLVTRPLIFISVFGGWALATWRIWRALMRRA